MKTSLLKLNLSANLSLFALVIFLSLTNFSKAQGDFDVITPNETSIGLYEKWEVDFSLTQTYSNPYDPNEIAIDAEITTPSGQVLTQPCFYYVPSTWNSNPNWWNYINLDPANSTWKLRFTPRETGVHQVTLNLTDVNGTNVSSVINFTCTSSSEKGFVNIHPNNKQYNQFDNGDPYYPIGTNYAWRGDPYGVELPKMANGGANWFRYWMTDFSGQSLIWSSGHWSGRYSGLENYSQAAAAELDSVIELAAENGMYCQININDHGQFSTTAAPRWSTAARTDGYAGNPFNVEEGGMCTTTDDFFSRADAKEIQKRMYRYIIARWGYSPNIFAWELFNEVQFTNSGSSHALIDDWHDEMSIYIKSIDAHKHITTTSWESPGLNLLTDNAALDNLQYHLYSSGIEQANANKIDLILPSFPNQQIFCGEFGASISSSDYTSHPDVDGDHIRKTNWISLMKQTPSFFWYWDHYIKDGDNYDVYQPLMDYTDSEDFGSLTGLAESNAEITNATMNDVELSFSPSFTGSWGDLPPPASVFSIDANGNLSHNESDMQKNLFGTWHPIRGSSMEFSANFVGPGEFTLDIGQVSGSGSKAFQISVDGVIVSSAAFTGAEERTIAIPAGARVINIQNLGQDWVRIDAIKFKGIVQSATIGVYTKQNTDNAYGYIYDKSYGDWAPSSGLVENNSIKLENLMDGEYELTYHYPFEETSDIPEHITVNAGEVTLDLPDFYKDIAFKLKLDNITSNNEISSLDDVKIFPNPSNGIFFIKSDANFEKIEVLDMQGRRVFTNSNLNTFDLSTQDAGTYFVRLFSSSETKTVPVLIGK